MTNATPDLIILIAGTAWLIPLLQQAFASQDNDNTGENS